MPVYTYQCEVCGTFDQQNTIANRDSQKCTSCNGDVKRVINVGAVYAPTCGKGLA